MLVRRLLSALALLLLACRAPWGHGALLRWPGGAPRARGFVMRGWLVSLLLGLPLGRLWLGLGALPLSVPPALLVRLLLLGLLLLLLVLLRLLVLLGLLLVLLAGLLGVRGMRRLRGLVVLLWCG